MINGVFKYLEQFHSTDKTDNLIIFLVKLFVNKFQVCSSIILVIALEHDISRYKQKMRLIPMIACSLRLDLISVTTPWLCEAITRFRLINVLIFELKILTI